ncbi:PREDICTED: uncharacterized protein LOC109164891 [Ipomoea nil]|uniref:uncharacterized protein LOC109164891 n=1 Tax=Ipomoea nil TaxID=35883 RepID=UPI000900B5C9|nr:PREDICTED: uncharacterized protein LOC109164891 [Ipomoea nil]
MDLRSLQMANPVLHSSIPRTTSATTHIFGAQLRFLEIEQTHVRLSTSSRKLMPTVIRVRLLFKLPDLAMPIVNISILMHHFQPFQQTQEERKRVVRRISTKKKKASREGDFFFFFGGWGCTSKSFYFCSWFSLI